MKKIPLLLCTQLAPTVSFYLDSVLSWPLGHLPKCASRNIPLSLISKEPSLNSCLSNLSSPVVTKFSEKPIFCAPPSLYLLPFRLTADTLTETAFLHVNDDNLRIRFRSFYSQLAFFKLISEVSEG